MTMTSPVLLGRAATFSLGLIQSFAIIYTCATDGSPFRKELLTPWMAATLVDFYILIALLAVRALPYPTLPCPALSCRVLMPCLLSVFDRALYTTVLG